MKRSSLKTILVMALALLWAGSVSSITMGSTEAVGDTTKLPPSTPKKVSFAESDPQVQEIPSIVLDGQIELTNELRAMAKEKAGQYAEAIKKAQEELAKYKKGGAEEDEQIAKSYQSQINNNEESEQVYTSLANPERKAGNAKTLMNLMQDEFRRVGSSGVSEMSSEQILSNLSAAESLSIEGAKQLETLNETIANAKNSIANPGDELTDDESAVDISKGGEKAWTSRIKRRVLAPAENAVKGIESFEKATNEYEAKVAEKFPELAKVYDSLSDVPTIPVPEEGASGRKTIDAYNEAVEGIGTELNSILIDSLKNDKVTAESTTKLTALEARIKSSGSELRFINMVQDIKPLSDATPSTKQQSTAIEAYNKIVALVKEVPVAEFTSDPDASNNALTLLESIGANITEKTNSINSRSLFERFTASLRDLAQKVPYLNKVIAGNQEETYLDDITDSLMKMLPADESTTTASGTSTEGLTGSASEHIIASGSHLEPTHQSTNQEAGSTTTAGHSIINNIIEHGSEQSGEEPNIDPPEPEPIAEPVVQTPSGE